MTVAGLGVEGTAAVTALLCTPAGVIVLTVVGAAAVGYASYKVSEQVGELWDHYGTE